MICRTCGNLIPELKLVCVYCVEQRSKKAFLELQRQYVSEILTGEAKLQLAEQARGLPQHIRLIQDPRHAFCGAELSYTKRSQETYRKLKRDLTCAVCLETLDKIIAESHRECPST
jgi:hypothetical protein